MKKMLSAVLLAACLTGSPALAAQEQDSKAAAARLLESMNMAAILEQSLDASLDVQLQSQPAMQPYRAVLRAFLIKYMSYEALKPRMVDIYASEFTAAELDAAADFYRTPAGRKFQEKMPTLLAKGMEMGQKAVEEHTAELEEAMKAEVERIKNASAPAPKG